MKDKLRLTISERHRVNTENVRITGETPDGDAYTFHVRGENAWWFESFLKVGTQIALRPLEIYEIYTDTQEKPIRIPPEKTPSRWRKQNDKLQTTEHPASRTHTAHNLSRNPLKTIAEQRRKGNLGNLEVSEIPRASVFISMCVVFCDLRVLRDATLTACSLDATATRNTDRDDSPGLSPSVPQTVLYPAGDPSRTFSPRMSTGRLSTTTYFVRWGGHRHVPANPIACSARSYRPTREPPNRRLCNVERPDAPTPSRLAIK